MSDKALATLIGVIIAVGIIGFSFYALSKTKDNTDDLNDKYDTKTEEIFGTMNYQTPQDRINEMGVYLNA